jgi:glucose/arabinose dehydrogenase
MLPRKALGPLGAAFLLSTSALADPPSNPTPPEATVGEASPASTGATSPKEVRSYFNLRVGAASSNQNGKPEVCGEVNPIALLSVESCGTGADIWSDGNGVQIAHLRTNVRLFAPRVGDAVLEPRLGAGIAELQVAPDDPGLKVSSTGPRRVETAGPEAAASLRLLYPTAYGIEAVAALSAGLAYFAHARELVQPQRPWQPFVGASLGAGFLAVRATGIVRLVCLATGALAASSCFSARPSQGGGKVGHPDVDRPIRLEDVALPPGYRIEAVASKLEFPTGVAIDDRGTPYVVEAGYTYGEAFSTARLVRVEPGGGRSVVATSENGPWNGVVFHAGAFYVAEGGEKEGGRILRISPEGKVERLVEGLPSLGDHHTNGPAVGPDGMIYFGQGTATNSGIVGPDNVEFGWLKRHPDFHDVPCKDVTLAGKNYESKDALGGSAAKASTGAFVPFGTPTKAGQIIPGKLPCSGAIFRVPGKGGTPELVAWGFRNPYGLAFAPDGKLYVTENGFDVRGSRPVFGAGDNLWRIESGTWYGWPDFSGGRSLTEDQFNPPIGAGEGGSASPGRLLASPAGNPPAPMGGLN